MFQVLKRKMKKKKRFDSEKSLVEFLPVVSGTSVVDVAVVSGAKDVVVLSKNKNITSFFIFVEVKIDTYLKVTDTTD